MAAGRVVPTGANQITVERINELLPDLSGGGHTMGLQAKAHPNRITGRLFSLRSRGSQLGPLPHGLSQSRLGSVPYLAWEEQG